MRSDRDEEERQSLLSVDTLHGSYGISSDAGEINETNQELSGALHQDASIGTSWQKASFLIINAALGAGLLNFPAAFEESGGIASGNITHIIFVILALGSLTILAKCASERNCNTYQEVIKEFCGIRWSLLCSIAITLYCFVTCITFIIIIGDQFDRAFASFVGSNFCHYWYLDRRFTMTLSSLFLIVPCCFKRIDGLQGLSYIGVVSIWYLIAVIVVEMESSSYTQGQVIIWNFDINILSVLPTICFGYQCHVSSVPIYSCLRKKDFNNFVKACCLSIAICVTVYTVSANCGYITFGSLIQGDILLSYDATKPHVLIALFLLALKSWTTYPILLYCVREAVSDIYLQWANISEHQASISEPKRRMSIAIVLWLASIILAIFTPNIDIVVKLLGSLASAFILTFPGLCWFYRTLDKVDNYGWNFRNRTWFLVSIIYLLFGVMTFGLAFTLGIQNVFNPRLVVPLCV